MEVVSIKTRIPHKLGTEPNQARRMIWSLVLSRFMPRGSEQAVYQ